MRGFRAGSGIIICPNRPHRTASHAISSPHQRRSRIHLGTELSFRNDAHGANGTQSSKSERVGNCSLAAARSSSACLSGLSLLPSKSPGERAIRHSRCCTSRTQSKPLLATHFLLRHVCHNASAFLQRTDSSVLPPVERCGWILDNDKLCTGQTSKARSNPGIGPRNEERLYGEKVQRRYMYPIKGT